MGDVVGGCNSLSSFHGMANITEHSDSAIAYREEQHSGLKMFMALLCADSKFVHSAIANSCI